MANFQTALSLWRLAPLTLKIMQLKSDNWIHTYKQRSWRFENYITKDIWDANIQDIWWCLKKLQFGKIVKRTFKVKCQIDYNRNKSIEYIFKIYIIPCISKMLLYNVLCGCVYLYCSSQSIHHRWPSLSLVRDISDSYSNLWAVM